MANYIENFNSKLDWAMPFQRTGKFPLDRTSMFDSYEDAVKYAAGAPATDSRGLGGSSYVGQLIVVFENDVVTVYKINADRNIEALTSESGVNADILELTTNLNAEITARKAVDGQNGQTYAANTSAKHISAATSLNDADIKLNNAITAETKARQDAIDALDATVSSSTTNVGVTVVQTNGKLESVTLTQTDIASAAALTAEIAARKAVDGQTGQTYAANTSAKHISAATSLNDADIKLNNAITAETKARQDAINALDKTIENENGNFSIVITQTDGLLNSLEISDVVLSDSYTSVEYPEVESVTFTAAKIGDTLDVAIKKVDQNVVTLVEETLKNEEVVAAAITEIKESVGLDENLKYVKNTSANYIQNATTFSDADNLLDSAIKAEVIARENAISNLSSALTESLNDEIETRQRIEGQNGTAYTKNTTSTYISGATSMNDADVKLDSAIKNLKLTAVTGTELTGLGENVKEAYKLIDGNSTIHGDYIKIYKDSSLKSVALSGQILNFTYILANGTETVVPVDMSAFLAESEYADGLQVNNHIISVKKDSSSESFLSVSANGIKISGVQDAINTAINSLDEDITSDDIALVSVQVKQENGKITDVVVTGNDIDCGTF